MPSLKLPRLESGLSIVDSMGRALGSFHTWWDKVCRSIEGQERIQDQLIADLQATTAALEVTQAELDTTQTEVGTAQGDITAIQSDIADLTAGVIALGDALLLYAEKAGDTFTGPVDVQALLRCDSLRLDQAPTAEALAPTHSVTFSANGTNYKIPVQAA